MYAFAVRDCPSCLILVMKTPARGRHVVVPKSYTLVVVGQSAGREGIFWWRTRGSKLIDEGHECLYFYCDLAAGDMVGEAQTRFNCMYDMNSLIRGIIIHFVCEHGLILHSWLLCSWDLSAGVLSSKPWHNGSSFQTWSILCILPGILLSVTWHRHTNCTMCWFEASLGGHVYCPGTWP